MDIKQRQLHAKIMATGIAQVPVFEGPLQKIAIDFLQWCMSQKIQMDSHGILEINLRVSNKRMDAQKDDSHEDYKMTPQYLNMIQGIRQATPEEEQAYQDSLNLPWKADPMWWKFSELGATQKNYESNAEHYAQLWAHFTTKWPELLNHLKRRSR